MQAADRLEEGRAALARRDWPNAYRLLAEADPADLTADELEGLATAANCMSEYEAAIEARERAHAGYVAAGNVESAAWTALRLAEDCFVRGDLAVAGGWRATADRLLADAPECAAHALALRSDAYLHLAAGAVDAAADASRQAVEIARRVGHRDVEMVALQFEGHARSFRGELAEGMALMDEAMVAAVSGQVGPWAFNQIVCQTLTACQELGDYRRATEWLERADRVAGAEGMPIMSSDCRIHRAEILRLRGSWARAESEARIGCAGHPYGWHQGWGWCEIGEIHLRMGDLEGAEDAFSLAHEQGYPPHPGLALLRLTQGDIERATVDIEQAYLAASTAENVPARAGVLDARTRIALASGDVETARRSADELGDVAATCGSPAFTAFATCADGQVRAAEGDPAGAAEALRHGVAALVELDLPYETATTRCALADVLDALGDRDGALMERRAARSTFARLGSVIDERAVAALLPDSASENSETVAKTFMFTDIERSTLLLEALGDEAWDRMLQWHDRTLRAAIAAAGGREVKHEGDGLFAAFDAPGDAVGAAVSIQQHLDDHCRDHGFAPRVRIGLHRGTATERDGDYFGLAVNTTARVMSVAAGGEIVATAETLDSAEQVSPPRLVELKGLRDPVRVVTVPWERDQRDERSAPSNPSPP